MDSMNSVMTKPTVLVEHIAKRDRADAITIVSMLADPLTRKIMAKLASKYSPIAANAVPVERLNASKLQIMSRLCKLERYGLVTAKKKTMDGSFYKEYHINDNGLDLVNNHMSNELSKFQSA